MAATAKLAGAEREKLFAQLEVPFDPAQVKWRVMRTSNGGDRSDYHEAGQPCRNRRRVG